MSTNYTGVPTAAESPAAAPAGGTYPIVVLPDDGDPLNAASVEQAYKVLADYMAYTMSRPAAYSMNIADQFTGSGINSGMWLTTTSGTGAVAIATDTTAGACGALHHSSTTAGMSSIATQVMNVGGASGNNFRIETRVRMATISTGTYTVGLVSATSGHNCYLYSLNGNNWRLVYGGAATDEDTGTATSSSYQNISITRVLVSGVPYTTVLIDGSLIPLGAVIDTSDLSDCALTSKSNATGVGAQSIFVDRLSLGAAIP